MNITSITSNIVTAPLLSKPIAPDAEKALPSLQKIEEDPREARAKAFYTREAEPWKGKTYIYSEFGGPEEERPLTKEMYLEDLQWYSNLELRIQQSMYSKIKNELGVFRPDLASKNFSYTLGDDAQVKILDPEKSLSEGDMKYLTTLLNDRRGFRDSVCKHAKMVMALVDHDDKAFGGKYKMDLLNIQNTLDYGKLIAQKPEKMYEAFVRQIIENGEKREEPLVDITA
ncbi:hypothetical protein PS3A_40880 [Pseudomonas sp. 3A(2025)]